MMRRFLILGLAALAIAGCGRKEMPIADTGKPPAITNLSTAMAGNSLRLTFTLTGGSGPVGYQIDRAEIDPVCQCPTDWRRFYEQPAIPGQKNKELTKALNLRTAKRTFFFRIRAVDAFGNLGPWSQTIRARAEQAPGEE